MRPISREVLARDAAAKMAAIAMPVGDCAGNGKRWSQLERQHRHARGAAAKRVVEEVRGEFCSGCPALLACGQWAKTQEYTGLAAGAAYERGQRKESTWAVPVGGRVRKVAS